MSSSKTRRYSIDIKDPDNNSVLFTAVDWTDEERLVAVAKILRLAGLPEDNGFAAPAAQPKKGGGKTMPQASIDPVVMAAATVLRLQTIVSREVAATEAAVVTVGVLHAGTKENVIPDDAIIKLNVRTFDEGCASVCSRRSNESSMRRLRRRARPGMPEITTAGPLSAQRQRRAGERAHCQRIP